MCDLDPRPLVGMLKLSTALIHLLWSRAARLTRIRGLWGELQGACWVITSVLGCSEVSHRHRAAGGHNLAVFCLPLNRSDWICVYFPDDTQFYVILLPLAEAISDRGHSGHVRLLQYSRSVQPVLTTAGGVLCSSSNSADPFRAVHL